MKRRLNFRETLGVASMLFGMFFGAGNLIFPVYMGQLAGRNVLGAILGFLVTGVGLPLLGVAALGVSRSDGLVELSGKVGRRYGTFFTCALYLTIGPCFAIPRCATVPFTVGVEPLTGGANAWLLPLFSLIFFAIVLAFSLKPGKILTWVGKILNPVFLICLGVLVAATLIRPMGRVAQIEPAASYATGAFFTGFLEGYNTMDALAGLAFGIVVVNVIRSLGISEPGAVAGNTVRAGVFSCLFMGLIYLFVTLMGVTSRGVYAAGANGGEALAVIARHYFGTAGGVILALTVTLACLKTAVGLITSCASTFSARFSGGKGYRVWAIAFCVFSFLVANLGLTSIITYAVPVLMFLYPLAITLILLALFGRFYGNDPAVYRWVTALTFVAAVLDLIRTLPAPAIAALRLGGLIEAVAGFLPFYKLGLGWICPALLGLAIGLIVRFSRRRANA